jgi:hypothetical protein
MTRWLNRVALVKDMRDGHEILVAYYKSQGHFPLEMPSGRREDNI